MWASFRVFRSLRKVPKWGEQHWTSSFFRHELLVPAGLRSEQGGTQLGLESLLKVEITTPSSLTFTTAIETQSPDNPQWINSPLSAKRSLKSSDQLTRSTTQSCKRKPRKSNQHLVRCSPTAQIPVRASTSTIPHLRTEISATVRFSSSSTAVVL